LHDDLWIGAAFAAAGFIPVGATTEWLPRARTLLIPCFFGRREAAAKKTGEISSSRMPW
jgi:hypothetical protein